MNVVILRSIFNHRDHNFDFDDEKSCSHVGTDSLLSRLGKNSLCAHHTERCSLAEETHEDEEEKEEEMEEERGLKRQGGWEEDEDKRKSKEITEQEEKDKENRTRQRGVSIIWGRSNLPMPC